MLKQIASWIGANQADDYQSDRKMADDLGIDAAMEIPQSQKMDDDQKINNAGGYSYVITDENRLRRFLCLGSEGGTFYVGEKELGISNAQCIQRLIADGKGKWLVDELKTFSLEGRTAKQNPLMFALALCARQEKDVKTKQAAYATINEVCRIPTHLFMFIDYCEKLSRGTGWGRAHRRAIGNWYLQFAEDPKKLAIHVTKYKNREGWTHRDVLRLAHPKPTVDGSAAIIRYIMKGLDQAKKDFLTDEMNDAKLVKTFKFLEAVENIKTVQDSLEVAELIQKHHLVREHIPTTWLNDSDVWQALLEKMPMTAMIRNLGKMTSVGILKKGYPYVEKVTEKLNDNEQLKKARIHPYNVLVALYQYKKGKGDKGKLSWEPNEDIVRSLDDAFYKCFKYVEPTNQRYLLAVDVSGSMGWGGINGSNSITPRDASAALAMVTARTERICDIVGFSTNLQKLPINADMKLEEVLKEVDKIPMGGTDCAQPMLWAKKYNKLYDVFIVYTDNETWFGNIHPAEALRRYRKATGIWNAKLIVMGMTATEFTIADPKDPGMLDMVGFDSSGPEIIRNFVTDKL